MTEALFMSQSSKELVCNRCGSCCYLRLEGQKQKCKYLVHLRKGTACRIYGNRLGKFIGHFKGKNFYCSLRKDVKFNFENCPYNVEGQELLR